MNEVMVTRPQNLYPKGAMQVTYTPFVQEIPAPAGAIDVVGDIHGCMSELVLLLTQAGYVIESFDDHGVTPIAVHHPEGRKLVLVGDLTDRGPRSDLVLRLAMGLQASGNGHVLMGNHDWKLFRHLMGRKVQIQHGLPQTLEQIAPLGDSFCSAILSFYEQVPHQLKIPLSWDHSYGAATSLWVVHAAAKAHRQGKSDRSSFERSIYGYADGTTDEVGSLIRDDWAADYEGLDPVIHGHVVHREPSLKNGVLCLDTGCVFGNKLTLFRVDRQEFLSVAAAKNYAGIDKLMK